MLSAERTGDEIFNAVGIIGADGVWLGTRCKNPLYAWGYETRSFAESDPSRRSSVFQTGYGRVGVSICFDGEFPGSVRQMRLDGAESLLWCNAACTDTVYGDNRLGTGHRLHHSAAHAQVHALWVACCNCVGPNTTGSSCIVSPIGDPLVILSPDEEELGVAQADLAWRSDWSVWRERLWCGGYAGAADSHGP